jgi:hypothetical protein
MFRSPHLHSSAHSAHLNYAYDIDGTSDESCDGYKETIVCTKCPAVMP